MTLHTLNILNKNALIKMIIELEEKLGNVVYTCMDCNKEFEKLENNACPYCKSGDIHMEIVDE